MRIAGAIIIICCWAIAGCALPLNSDLARDTEGLAADPNTPELALLEYRLQQHFRTPADPTPTTCAGVGQYQDRKPLPSALEDRLLSRFPKLAPFARCEWSGSVFRDSETRGLAIIFDVHELECATPTLCSAWSGYHQSDRTNGWRLYELRFDRYWRIREKSLEIVLTGKEN